MDSTTTMTKQNPTANVVAQYGSITSSQQFEDQIERTWSALETFKETTKQLVNRDELTPVQAVGILACTAGQLFGYQAFHGQPTVADVLQAIASNGAQQQRQQQGASQNR